MPGFTLSVGKTPAAFPKKYLKAGVSYIQVSEEAEAPSLTAFVLEMPVLENDSKPGYFTRLSYGGNSML